MKNNIIKDRSFAFSLQLIECYKLMNDKREYVLSKQLLRSGTSIGANIEEAIAGQSKRDFLSKMTIALKECRETHYWLRLLSHSQLVELDYKKLLQECEERLNILSAIVKTTRGNLTVTNSNNF
jgi:four helix bundle protein